MNDDMRTRMDDMQESRAGFFRFIFKMWAAYGCVAATVWLAFVGAVGYIVLHFVMKYW